MSSDEQVRSVMVRVNKGCICSMCHMCRQGYHRLEMRSCCGEIQLTVCDDCVREMGKTLDYEEMAEHCPDSVRIGS